MRPHFFPRDEYFMRLALREAERALEHDDVPIGTVVVHEGEVIGAGRNERELRQDPTAHAEMIAIREASRGLASWRLKGGGGDGTLRARAVWGGRGPPDPRAGAAGSVWDVLPEPRLNHSPEVAGGLLADEAAALLQDFF